MRLKASQVKLVCQNLLQQLRTKQLVVLKKPDVEVLAAMESIFTKELRIEDQINQEAEKLLAQYEKQMGDSIDRDKMFQMIKRQLIKDKKVVL